MFDRQEYDPIMPNKVEQQIIICDDLPKIVTLLQKMPKLF